MELTEIGKFPELHDRASAALDTLLNRVLEHLSGLERTVVNQAVAMLYPRVQRKVHEATEDQLRSELVYFRDLIDAVIPDEEKQSSKSPTRKPNKTRQRKSITPRRGRR